MISALLAGFLVPMRVLVTPDKFKGTLTAQEAAAAIAEGWALTRPDDSLDAVPMSDGGDGFGEIVGRLLGAELRTAETSSAAHEPVTASWWWSSGRSTAIVESARAIGLAMLPKGRFHPFELDTEGLGIWLRQIAAEHPGAALIVGIGGSATNDGGFGMARALGFRFVGSAGASPHQPDGRSGAVGEKALRPKDTFGKTLGSPSDEASGGIEIERWTDLSKLDRIESPAAPLNVGSIIIATDVQNPLLGPEGASRIYGPQKGLRPEDMAAAEASLQRLAEVAARDLGRDVANDSGAGAAGGLGFGLRAFLSGRFEPGFDIFARLANLEERIRASDLVITAEGCIDAQTQMGKGTGAVAVLARKLGKRCLGLAGFARERGGVFAAVHGVHPDLTSLEAAMAEPARWLRELSARAAQQAGNA